MFKTFLKTAICGAGFALGSYLMVTIIDKVGCPYHRAKFRRKFTNNRRKFKVINCEKKES